MLFFLLPISWIGPASRRDGETVTLDGVIDALRVIGAGARGSLANSSSPQPPAPNASTTATPAAVHGVLRIASSVLTSR